METPEEFLEQYHNNIPTDWLFEKREVVANLIKQYTEKVLHTANDSRSNCQTFLSDGAFTSATKCMLCGKEQFEHRQPFK